MVTLWKVTTVEASPLIAAKIRKPQEELGMSINLADNMTRVTQVEFPHYFSLNPMGH